LWWSLTSREWRRKEWEERTGLTSPATSVPKEKNGNQKQKKAVLGTLRRQTAKESEDSKPKMGFQGQSSEEVPPFKKKVDGGGRVHNPPPPPPPKNPPPPHPLQRSWGK